MNELNEKEQIMRDYWLGILTGSQMESCETNWFSNDEDAELLEIAKADLIDDYLSKNLTQNEYSHFEKNFLLDNLEDVVLAKSFLQISREELSDLKKENFFERFLSSFRSFITIPQIAAAVLLLGCFGLWLKFYDSDSSRQIALNIEPTADVKNDLRTNSENKNDSGNNSTNYHSKDVPIDENKDKNVNSKTGKESNEVQNPVINRNSDSINKQLNENKAAVSRQVVFLTVFRGNVRILSLNDPKESITLKLTMPGIDKAYKHYELKIYDAAGNLIVKQNLGSNLSLKKSGEILTMPPVKGSLFKKNNTYQTYLVGIDENDQENQLIDYDGFKIK